MVNYFWFRRDLRMEDNAGLYHALKTGKALKTVFIFDTQILSKLQDKKDARVTFIHDALVNLKEELETYGSTLHVHFGNPEAVWTQIIQEEKEGIENIYSNEDYESYSIQRDDSIRALAEKSKIGFRSYKDQIIFGQSEVVKDDGTPYTVFTPYKKKWLKKLGEKMQASYFLKAYPTKKYADHLFKEDPQKMKSLKDIGFDRSDLPFPSKEVKQGLIKNYDQTRDFPAVNGTTKLGVHFRFGTISIREKARKSLGLNATYLSELVWRDFYSQILFHFPHVEKSAFRAKYERIVWRNNEKEFEAWKKGMTGYPMVDAGMRELNSTGHMHNRVRMVVASFLTKHLLIDWRWGEQYFADKLLDFDLASNNGGWQWASGSGTDAAPYFRVFNPTLQLKRFDKELVYVKKWVPEYDTPKYVKPIVDHKMARERCLTTYKEALSNL